MDSVLAVNPLPRVRGGIGKRFNAYANLPTAFDFYGMERGGHFAFIHWLISLDGAPYMFVPQANTSYPGSLFYSPSGWHGVDHGPPKYIAFSYSPDTDITLPYSRIDSKRVVLLVRDVRNLMASRIKFVSENARVPVFKLDNMSIALWREYAKQALGDTDNFDGQCVPVVYDKWFASRSYRMELIDRLNARFNWTLPHNDNEKILNRIADPAGGSSFDRREFENKAQQMNVLNRWKQCLEHPFLQRVINDPALMALNNRLIGD